MGDIEKISVPDVKSRYWRLTKPPVTTTTLSPAPLPGWRREQHPGLQVQPGTGARSGGVRLRVQFPNRRTVLVMYGEIVARSAGSTGSPSAATALAASVMSQAVEYMTQLAISSLNLTTFSW